MREVEEEEEEGGQRCRKTLRLSSDRLVDLNLKPGRNEVEFSVTTAFQVVTLIFCYCLNMWHLSRVLPSADAIFTYGGTQTRYYLSHQSGNEHTNL